jgi:hypothetical protein
MYSCDTTSSMSSYQKLVERYVELAALGKACCSRQLVSACTVVGNIKYTLYYLFTLLPIRNTNTLHITSDTQALPTLGGDTFLQTTTPSTTYKSNGATLLLLLLQLRLIATVYKSLLKNGLKNRLQEGLVLHEQLCCDQCSTKD